MRDDIASFTQSDSPFPSSSFPTIAPLSSPSQVCSRSVQVRASQPEAFDVIAAFAAGSAKKENKTNLRHPNVRMCVCEIE